MFPVSVTTVKITGTEIDGRGFRGNLKSFQIKAQRDEWDFTESSSSLVAEWDHSLLSSDSQSRTIPVHQGYGICSLFIERILGVINEYLGELHFFPALGLVVIWQAKTLETLKIQSSWSLGSLYLTVKGVPRFTPKNYTKAIWDKTFSSSPFCLTF